MVDEQPDESAQADAGADARKPGWKRWLAIRALIGLASVAPLLVAAALLLDTGPGRRLVAEQIQALQFDNGMRIGIGRIEGSLYGAVVIHDLSLKDPEGEFLFAPRIDLDWRPLAWLSNHLDIRSAEAERMMLRRLPIFRETPPSDEPLLPDFDIDIGDLKVTHFVIEEPVTGERRIATLSGKAHIADGRAQVNFTGEAVAVAGGGAGDRIAIDLDAHPEKDRLTLKASIDAPSGGVLAAMTGVKIPVALNVGGGGSWQKWDGVLEAGSGETRLARLKLVARDGSFSLKGPARLARLTSGTMARLLGPVAQFDLTASLDDGTARLGGNIASTAFRLDTDGAVDLSDNRFEQLKLGIVVREPSALDSRLSGSGLRANLTLDGDFAAPRMQYSLAAARLAIGEVGLQQFSASGMAKVDGGTILVPLNARVRRVTGLDAVAGGRLDLVRLDGDLAVNGARVIADNIRIRSERINASAILLADLNAGRYSGSVDGRIDRYRLESVGIFNVAADADLKMGKPSGFALKGRLRARSTRLLNEGLGQVLGGNFVAAGDVRYRAGALSLANLRLEAPELKITSGAGSYLPDGRIALRADATSLRYGPIGLQLDGTLTDPDALITAENPGLGIGLAGLEARITGAGESYRFAVTGSTDYGPLTAEIALEASGPMVLQIERAELSGVNFVGSLRQLPEGPFTGALRANGNGLGGIVRLDAVGGIQQAQFKLRSTGTVFAGPARLAIGSAIIDGTAVFYERPHIIADTQLANLRFRQFDIKAARIRIDYRDGSGQAKALIEGGGGAPFRLSANAQLEPKIWRVALSGKFRGIQFGTVAPARIVPAHGEYELLATQIKVGSGRIRLAGSYGETVRIQSRLEGVDLALVNAFVPGFGIGGKASGSLNIAQASPKATPQADARLKIAGFTRTTALFVSQPIDVNLSGKLLDTGGNLRAVFRARGGVIGRLQATLAPKGRQPASWQEWSLGGGVRYNGPADTLLSFAGQPDQLLFGSIAVAADFSCRLADPCLAGIVRGSDLTYEHRTLGTRLSSLDLSGRFDGNRLKIERMTAKAGEGSVSATGHVGLSSAAGFPTDLAISLDRAMLARSDAVSTSATGELRLTKAAGGNALLSGTLRLPETRYRIVREAVTLVPQLAGVRFLPPKGRKRTTGDELLSSAVSLFDGVRLDIELVAPEKLYVAGMGLDSEWGAKFRLLGTPAQPRLDGSFALKRGTLGFAGKSFKLAKGQIRFTGGQAIDPELSLKAVETIEDLDVSVDISGRASDPKVAFSSVPGLPQDEIIARILFGRSIANLSALQAVQLAASLNSLRGSGSGLNPLGKLRSATGIDRLRIVGPDGESGQGTALAAGQYLTDDIYVELITDTRGFTATQLEVSLTPWLSVLSRAGGSGGSDINFRIKKDY